MKVMGIQNVLQTQLFHLQDENEHELGLVMEHTLGCQLESRLGHGDHGEPQLGMQVEVHVLEINEDLPHELVDCQRWMGLVNGEPQLVWVNDEPQGQEKVQMALVNDEPQLVWVNDETQGQEKVQMALVMKQNSEHVLVHELAHGLVHELVHGLVQRH